MKLQHITSKGLTVSAPIEFLPHIVQMKLQLAEDVIDQINAYANFYPT